MAVSNHFKPMARLLITPDFLRQLLYLPESVDILGSNINRDYVEVMVADPAFVRGEGEPIPTVKALFQRQPDVVFQGWEKY